MFAAQPSDDPGPGVGAQVGEGGAGHAGPEVGSPAPQQPVERQQQDLQRLGDATAPHGGLCSASAAVWPGRAVEPRGPQDQARERPSAGEPALAAQRQSAQVGLQCCGRGVLASLWGGVDPRTGQGGRRGGKPARGCGEPCRVGIGCIGGDLDGGPAVSPARTPRSAPGARRVAASPAPAAARTNPPRRTGLRGRSATPATPPRCATAASAPAVRPSAAWSPRPAQTRRPAPTAPGWR